MNNILDRSRTTGFGPKMTRRSLFRHGLRLALLAALGVGFVRRDNLTVESVNLAFDTLPSAFAGFRIIQISDLHASYWVDKAFLDRVVDQVNRMEKDLLVITGDIITGAVNDFWSRWLPKAGGDHLETAIDALRNLSAGPKLAVLGNHDQWAGISTELRLVRELEGIGIGVLRNASCQLPRGDHSIAVAGTDDVWFTADAAKALKGIPQDQFTVLLSHSPDIRSDLGPRSRVELTLCGHTHGGQVVIPYLTRRLMPIDNPERYLSGLVQETYGYTYVNRGIGTLVFPLRFGAPPEITTIVLNRA